MSDRIFEISSPVRGYRHVPLVFTIKRLEKPEGKDWAFEDIETGEVIPLQPESGWWINNAWMRLILPSIEKGQVRRFKLIQTNPNPLRAILEQAGDDRIDMVVDGGLVAGFNYSHRWIKPFFWPLNGAGGTPLTRCWPMQESLEEMTDHVHHRSVWTAHGDIDGADFWEEGGGHGHVQQYAFEERTSGSVFCRVSNKCNWLSKEEKTVVRSYSDTTIYALPDDQRILDFTICFRSLEGSVRFGDTKEGGLLAVRVTASMNGDKGGMIENAYGGRTEAECWGKPAPWVDYSGPVKGETHGIAIFDNPENFFYPTRWHVRDYGLFAANPFAMKDYTGDPSADGARTLNEGEVWKIQYRMYLHRGDATEGGVRDQYLAYVNPPAVKEVVDE